MGSRQVKGIWRRSASSVFEEPIIKNWGDGVQCEESELWLRVCGRVREEEQEFDEASAGRSSEILTHSSCLTSLRGPGKRVPAFLIIPTGRGFETVSYLLEGEFTHEDFLGHRGVLKAGDLQWMTAGRGIVHSEMPGWEKTRGLQLWVNLPREQKMVAPTYQELSADQVLGFGDDH